MSKSASYKIMALLALVQGILGLGRAYNWVQIGVNLFGQGLLLLPFVGAVAVMRGLFMSVVALFYVLFVIGALLGKSWAWWPCLTAVIINLLLVLSAVVQGVLPIIQAILWSAVPVILLFYFFSQRGQGAVRSG